jgi:hypothetical protein
MFESLPPEPEALRRRNDAAVVAAIEEWARIEAAAGARRLDAIAELIGRRCDTGDERAHWACDNWDSAAAEVGAALGVRHNKPSGQMQLSLTLRDRLPKVADLYLEGKVSYRVISAIAWQTELVGDGEPVTLVDEALAKQAAKWGRLSDYKLAQAIDFWIDLHDPGALRRTRSRAQSRRLEVGDKDDKSDTTSVWGRLYATDAAALKQRLMEMAPGVCDDGRASSVVIHVVTEATALEAQPDPLMSGGIPACDPQPKCGAKPNWPAGLLLRGGIVPAPLLAELIRCGAKVRQVGAPGEVAEAGYRPSTALDEFVRVPDLTCRFPECDQPAEFCDIDHTIPYPGGPTHPSNLKCLCRKHLQTITFELARSPGGSYPRALRTSSAVGVSPNHFWSTASDRAWAWSLSAVQASETTIVRYPRSHAPRAVDSTATSVATPTSTRVSTPARRRMVSSTVRSNPLAACPLTTGSSGRGASSSMTSTAGVPSSKVLAAMAVRNSGEFGLTPGNPGWYVTRV